MTFRRLALTLACIAVAGCGSDDPGDAPAVLTLTPTTGSLDAGQTLQLTAELRTAAGVPVPDATYTWTSSAPGVATVTRTGTVTAVNLGAATISVSSGGFTQAAAITVVSAPLTIAVIPDTVRVLEGAEVQLTTTVSRDGVVVPGAPVTYAVSRDIATVSPGGLVTATAAGQATVTVSSGFARSDVPLVITGHPAGVTGFRLSLPSRPFGVAIGTDSTLLVTRLDAAAVAKGRTNSSYFTSMISVGAVPTDVTMGPTPATAYVTNQHSSNLGRLQVASATQAGTTPLPEGPFRVVRGNGTTAYVSGNAGNLFVVNTGLGTVTSTVPVNPLANGLALSPDGSHLYVSSIGSASVSEVSIATLEVLRTIAVGGTPQEVVIAPDASELYVANETGRMLVVTLATGEVASAGIGTENLFGMALSPDGELLYASRPGAGQVVVIARTSREVVSTLNTGGTPRRIAFDLLGSMAAVANEGGWVDLIR